jgi:DNA polymerase-3 subunit epsilon
MDSFVAIDFETGNPKRVSACALGCVTVTDCKIKQSKGFLIKPVGGHASFQSQIHGITDEQTRDKPDFKGIYPEIRDIFSYPLVAHSLFDKQVLEALSEYFCLGLEFEYLDTSAMAKEKLPNLKNHKLKTLVTHFGLPEFKHHDATEDAIACANIFLKLQGMEKCDKLPKIESETSEFIGMAKGILADDVVNYKEAYELLYWLQDHPNISNQYKVLYQRTKEVLEDDILDDKEAKEIKMLLEEMLEG